MKKTGMIEFQWIETVNLIIRDVFTDLVENSSRLSDSQLALIKSIKRYYQRNKKLSEKQLSVLLEMKKYCSSPEWIK